jgi:hypothetical protein
MSSNFSLIGAILFVCGSCYAQAPTSDVQVPSITNANSSMKLEAAAPLQLRRAYSPSKSAALRAIQLRSSKRLLRIRIQSS